MSTIVNAPDRPCVIVENRRFMEEAAMILSRQSEAKDRHTQRECRFGLLHIHMELEFLIVEDHDDFAFGL